MKITLVTPVPVTSLSGNRTTAVRWQRLLEELGHSTDVVQSWQGDEAEVLIALHARKSFDSIRRFHEVRPEAPLVVTLTGTDLYCDLDRSTIRSVNLAMGAASVALVTMLLILVGRLQAQETSLVRAGSELEVRRRELIRLERLALADPLLVGPRRAAEV